ncbi:MAG: hypothetical protein GKR89_27765 [Candidatus Latescibacteria bacterium]|nr:hypothetical protein [Candidatus Latescibacterota bacterium]
MGKWATRIFTSIDEGQGAGLDAVRGLGVSTVHWHTPSAENRTPQRTEQIRQALQLLDDLRGKILG